MHEWNTFDYDPILTMDRSDSPMNLPFLDDSLLQSDLSLQEMAVTTTDNTTAPFTSQSHNDLANNFLSSTSNRVYKTNNLFDFKADDPSVLDLINKDEIKDKIKHFSDDPVQPTATISLQQESASPISMQNSNLLNKDNECQIKRSFDQNTCPMLQTDINKLLDTYSKPNPKPDVDLKNPPKYDPSVPSTSGLSVATPQKKTDQPAGLNKNALAARANRLKKKFYVADLEKTVESLQKENQDLTQRLESVTSEYEKRGSEIEYLKNVLLNGETFSGILKNVPHIKSVGFPLKSTETDLCVGGMSPIKTKMTPGTSYCSRCKNNTDISENPLLPSSSFSPSVSSTPSSLQLRNINIMKDPPVGGGGVPDKKEPQKKDPLLRGASFNNCQDNKEQLEDLKKPQSGRVTKNKNQKRFSTWGAKSKKKDD